VSRNDDELEAVADRLRDLNLAELIDVLHRVLPAHNTVPEYGLAHRLVLAEATIYDQTVPRTAADPPVTLEVVAWPNHVYDDIGLGPQLGLYETPHRRRSRR